jgi:hypothetical protein
MVTIKYKKIPLLFFFISLNLLSLAQITPHEAVVAMQKGINLGNTHEPPTEGGWNNPKAEEYYFDLYKDAGFKLVRIPVRWDNYTGKTPPYKIDTNWLDRIEQVVDWGLKRGLFIIVNSHHDNWIKDDYSEENKARFDSIWTQISERFKDKSDSLIFEVLNEPHGMTKANNDDMHQRIISIIRKTNPTRLIIFQGNNWGSADDLINAQIPDDDYVIGSFHSYDPYKFGLLGEGTWGTSGDITTLENKFKKIKNWSDTNNIAVFLGEFGAVKKADYNSRMRHYRTYVSFAQKYGFACSAWDDGGNFRIMQREQHDWNEIKDILIHTSEKSPAPIATVYQDSIVKIQWSNYVSDNDSVIIQRKLKGQWHFDSIATIEGNTRSYLDIKPEMNNTYDYRVIAHYNDTTDFYSQPYEIYFPAWERKKRLPFNDTLMAIPGIIEAEYFDYGGEGLAYHDADEVNNPGDFRPNESVDIYDRLGNGYHIGNTLPGEWCEYMVDVKVEGWYNVTAHIAALYGGGNFQITVDTVKSDTLTALTGYSWLTIKPVSTKMYLYKGSQIMRFSVISTPAFNIDKIVFDLVTSATGYHEIQNKPPFIAYPNQSGELTIKQNRNSKAEIIKVYNISGSLVYFVTKPDKITTIPSEKTPLGIYLISSIENGRKFSQKVIVR